MTHYETLGVPKDATNAQIKRAYRTLAKGSHPDAGGKPGEFERHAEAYRILSDEDERAYYDQHGTEKPKDDGALQKMAAFLDFLLHSALQNIGGSTQKDLIKEMCKGIDEQHNAVKKQFKDVDHSLASYIKAKKRLKKGKKPLLMSILNNKIKEHELALVKIKEQEKFFDLARNELKGYVYTVPKDEQKPDPPMDIYTLRFG